MPGGYREAAERLLTWLHKTVWPPVLILVTFNFVAAVPYICHNCDGSYMEFAKRMTENPLFCYLALWKQGQSDSFAIKVILGYACFALFLMRVLPGKTYNGPITENGLVPKHKDNGLLQFFVTMLSLGCLQYFLSQRGMSVSVIYDRFGEIVVTLNILAFLFCIMLYFKGHYYPSTEDHETSGSVIFDFYSGTELYPRILGWDVKTFTNCRFGMMIWPIMVCIHCIKSYELHGFVDSMFVSATIQMVYLVKFYWWESGYMQTIDIAVDYAGYYICWGCLVMVPTVYTSPTTFLVSHPVKLGNILAAVFLAAGVTFVLLNYWADYQKQFCRKREGNCTIWGRKAQVVHAKYTTRDGTVHRSTLLVSGFWGWARHFHYLFELGLAFFWCVPGLFDYMFPFTYVIFLTGLLIHRTYRDDNRCKKKYAKYWEDYCKLVPCRIIPGIY